MSSLATLYPQHLATLQQRLEAALAAQGFDALAIAAGVEKYAFLDDRPYVFQPNPHFVHWLPLPQAIGSWLLLRPGRRPQLLYLQAEDYWHAPPATPSGYWTEAVEVEVLRTPEQLAARLKALVPARCAQIAEADAQCEGAGTPNPEALLALLHFERGMKTPYELQLMRAASQRAVLGHLPGRQRPGRARAALRQHRGAGRARRRAALAAPGQAGPGMSHQPAHRRRRQRPRLRGRHHPYLAAPQGRDRCG